MKRFTTFCAFIFFSLSVFSMDKEEELVTLIAGLKKYHVPKQIFQEALRETIKHGNSETKVKFGNVLGAKKHFLPHVHYTIVDLWFRVQKGQDLNAEELKIKVIYKEKVKNIQFDNQIAAIGHIKNHKPQSLADDMIYELHDDLVHILVPGNAMLLSLIEGSAKRHDSNLRQFSVLGVLQSAADKGNVSRVFFYKMPINLKKAERKIFIKGMSQSNTPDSVSHHDYGTQDKALQALKKYVDEEIILINKKL